MHQTRAKEDRTRCDLYIMSGRTQSQVGKRKNLQDKVVLLVTGKSGLAPYLRKIIISKLLIKERESTSAPIRKSIKRVK